MTIQFNTDNNRSGSIKNSKPVIVELTKEFRSYSSHITSLEDYHSDENGPKNGLNNLRYLLEAPIEEISD